MTFQPFPVFLMGVLQIFIFLRDWAVTVFLAATALFYWVIIGIATQMCAWHRDTVLAGVLHSDAMLELRLKNARHHHRYHWWIGVLERHRKKLTSCRERLRCDGNAEFVYWVIRALNRVTGGGA